MRGSTKALRILKAPDARWAEWQTFNQKGCKCKPQHLPPHYVQFPPATGEFNEISRPGLFNPCWFIGVSHVCAISQVYSWSARYSLSTQPWWCQCKYSFGIIVTPATGSKVKHGNVTWFLTQIRTIDLLQPRYSVTWFCFWTKNNSAYSIMLCHNLLLLYISYCFCFCFCCCCCCCCCCFC